jgi:CheY-like chemotaxis protein
METHKKKILVIDDDKDHVAGIRLVLENSNYEVASANSREEGFLKVKEVKPDLILLDILMGKGADGVLFARKLRHDEAYTEASKTPIIVMTSMRQQTGFWFPGEPKHDVFFPIDEILEKPVKPEVLLKKVRQMLGVKAG